MERFGYRQTMSCNGQVLGHSLFNNRSWNRLRSLADEILIRHTNSKDHLYLATVQYKPFMNLDVKKNVAAKSNAYEADNGYEDEEGDEAT
jgi:CTP:phosphocholine cytidylyltransferase-like protein